MISQVNVIRSLVTFRM